MAERRDKKRELARFAGEAEKIRLETIELFSFVSFFHGVIADSAYDDVEAGPSERNSGGKEGLKKSQRIRTGYNKTEQNKNTSQWRISGGEWWVRKAGENAMRLI